MSALKLLLHLIETTAMLSLAAVLIAVLGDRLDLRHAGHRLVFGVILGVAGVLSMIGATRIDGGLIGDSRTAVLVISGAFGGPLSAAVAAALVVVARVMLDGGPVEAILLSIVVPAIIGGLYHVWKQGRVRVSSLFGLGLLAAVIPLFRWLLLPDWTAQWHVLIRTTPDLALTNLIGVLSLGLLLLWDRERRVAAAALRESMRQLDAIANNTPGILFQRIVTPDGRHAFSYISDGVRRLIGPTPARIKEDPTVLEPMISPEALAAFRAEFARAAVNWRPVSAELALRGADDAEIWLRVNAAPHAGPDGSVVWDGIALDVTEHKRIEADLIKARRAAEAANASKSSFVSMVSHELRSPLTSIVLLTEMLLEEQLGPLGNPKYFGIVETIRKAGTQMTTTIGDLLDLSKAESGKIELHSGDVDVSDLLREIGELMLVRAHDAGLELDVRVPPRLVIRADRARLQQVVLNLATNAIRYTLSGGRVTLEASQTPGGGCEIRVIDTGIGIAPDDIEHAFEPFGQVDNNVNRAGGGTGLGLPLAKYLVELHGGSLTLESEQGSGTTARIVLSATPAGADATAMLPHAPDRRKNGPADAG